MKTFVLHSIYACDEEQHENAAFWPSFSDYTFICVQCCIVNLRKHCVSLTQISQFPIQRQRVKMTSFDSKTCELSCLEGRILNDKFFMWFYPNIIWHICGCLVPHFKCVTTPNVLRRFLLVKLVGKQTWQKQNA